MFSPGTKRSNLGARNEHGSSNLSRQTAPDSPSTPLNQNPRDYIPNRPSTGTPAPWASCLSVLARLDKSRFHVIGVVLFSGQQALLHPTHVVKTRMQVASPNSIHTSGMSVYKHVLQTDGIRGLFRGYGTSAIGALPGRVLALTSLEVSKDMMLKYTEALNMPEATRIGLANGFGGMLSNLVSCIYFVPLDVVTQRLIVQGLGGTTSCNGPFDVVRKVMKAEGYRGMYRGFGLTALTQSPASALWWGTYGAAQHIIWRSIGYRDNLESKPSHVEMVTVQATAGMVAGASSSVITTPIDTIKTRLQDLSHMRSSNVHYFPFTSM